MKFLLFPFSLIYFLVTSFRNFLYDNRILHFKPQEFDVHSISVGNLSVGGTGKTPVIEYLVGLFYHKYKVATLSRGYGRKTKGIILANANSTATEIGDEPKQFLHKFYPKIKVMVAEERSIAIPRLLSKHPETQVVLLDDAFQHRKAKPTLNILLSDYNLLFFRDYLLPMGRLRESRAGVNRADAIVITKCPEDVGYKMEYIRQKLKRFIDIEAKPVFFTGMKYGTPLDIFEPNLPFDFSSKIILVTGIAQAKPLKKYISDNFTLASHLEFSDHHNYSHNDFAKIFEKFREEKSSRKCIVTTEKDMMKWMESDIKRHLANIPVFYIPIVIYFLENEAQFQKLVMKGLK